VRNLQVTIRPEALLITAPHISGSCKVSLYSLSGRCVYSRETTVSRVFSVNREALSPGVYAGEIASETGMSERFTVDIAQ
jgi:hypothetical protein